MRQAQRLPKGWFYCQNCAKPKAPSPRRPIGSEKFCSANCRKEFWKNGGVSVHKLKVYVHQWVKEAIRPLQEQVNELRASR